MRNSLLKTMRERLPQGLETAKRLGASAAKLDFQHETETSCNFEAGRLKDTGGSETVVFHVEVLVDGRRGQTSGNQIEDIENLIERAIVLARVGSIAHFNAYPAVGKPVSITTWSEKTLGISRERLIDDCRHINNLLLKEDPQMYVQCSAGIHESEGIVATSGGVLHDECRTTWTLGAFVQRTTNTDMFMTGYGRDWCELNEFYDRDAIAETILEELQRARTSAEPPTGNVQAYLPPQTLERFLSPIFMGTNGRNVAKGDSPLAGRIGQQVLAPTLTIIDNPHRDFATGACETDGDGIPTKKLTVFENGVLKRFLYDLDSAGLAGVEPTGNDTCDLYHPMVLPGERHSDELMASIKDGLYIRDLIGFGQGNIINGDFSCNLGLGYRIRNGKIVGRVKNTMVAGNIYDLLSRNVQLSSDLDHEGRFPHAVIEGLNVSA